jgi:hypothetical protein
MGRLSDLRIVDAVLTELARGYVNPVLVADQLFPFAPTTKESVKIPVFAKEAFRIYATERAIRAKSNQINPEARSTVDAILVEHDLVYPVDRREAEEDVLPLRDHAAMVTVEGIRLKHEYLCGVLAQAAGSYPTGHKVTLSGEDQFTNAKSDPVAVIEAGKTAIRQKIGLRPNTMLIGALAMEALATNASLRELTKYSQTGVVGVDDLKKIFGIPNIVVGDAVYVDDADVSHDCWSDNIILAWQPAAKMAGQRTYYSPAFGYTIRKRGYPEVDAYTEEGGKIEMIRSTDLFVPKIVGSDAGYLIADTNAPTPGL